MSQPTTPAARVERTGTAREAAPAREGVAARIVRAMLFAWAVLLACPIRYWPINHLEDNTWVFALNYGAAHGLKAGRDLIWTTGPLGYLAFPQDIGSNLAQGIVFQLALWGVLAAILADLFFRAGIAVRNLVYFTLFFSLSAPLYWFNYMGTEHLLVAGVLVLLVTHRMRGGAVRFGAAAALAGVIPLLKLTGGIAAGGAVLGYLADRALAAGGRVRREAALAAGIWVLEAAAICATAIPPGSVAAYLKGASEVMGGYSSGMSLRGPEMEFGAVAQLLAAMGAYLLIGTRKRPGDVRFLAAILAVPVLLSLKHGFVRQDEHVLVFFCFMGVALATISTMLPAGGSRATLSAAVFFHYLLISTLYECPRVGWEEVFLPASGARSAAAAWSALQPGKARRDLTTATRKSYTSEPRLEPALRAILGDQPVASMSTSYAQLWLEGLHLRIPPVVQRYSAYTAYLDGANARWIAEKGPRYLLFDGKTIDERQPWMETPAMWLETYRWYNTRERGVRMLLLERRPLPRFEGWRTLARMERPLAGELAIPERQEPVFWTMSCGHSTEGSLRKLLFRIPEVWMRAGPEKAGTPWRVLPEVMSAPMPGGEPPATLGQFAALLEGGSKVRPHGGRLAFSGPGVDSYASPCKVEFLTPEGWSP